MSPAPRADGTFAGPVTVTLDATDAGGSGLGSTEYRVDGIETTIPFFTFIMNSPDFAAARFDTGFIDRILPEIDFGQRPASDSHNDAAIAAAAMMKR